MNFDFDSWYQNAKEEKKWSDSAKKINIDVILKVETKIPKEIFGQYFRIWKKISKKDLWPTFWNLKQNLKILGRLLKSKIKSQRKSLANISEFNKISKKDFWF